MREALPALTPAGLRTASARGRRKPPGGSMTVDLAPPLDPPVIVTDRIFSNSYLEKVLGP